MNEESSMNWNAIRWAWHNEVLLFAMQHAIRAHTQIPRSQRYDKGDKKAWLTFRSGQRRKLIPLELFHLGLCSSSGLFEESFYLAEYPDIARAGIDPLVHYLRHGGSEGRRPSRKFDGVSYLAAHSDVSEAGVNPLLHYIQHGVVEGRKQGLEGVLPQPVAPVLPEAPSTPVADAFSAFSRLEIPSAFRALDHMNSEQVRGLTEELSNCRAELTSTKDDALVALVQHEARMGELYAKADRLSGEEMARVRAERQLAEQEAYISNLQAKLDQLTSDADQAKAATASARAELRSQTIVVASLQTKIEELSVALTAKTTQAAQSERELERLQLEEKRLNQMRAEMEDLRVKMASLSLESERASALEEQLLVARADAAVWAERAEVRTQELHALNSSAPAMAAIATELKAGIGNIATKDTMMMLLGDVRDRLASRLEVLTAEIYDARRVSGKGREKGSARVRRLYLDLLESALTGTLTEDKAMTPSGAIEFDLDRRLYGRDWPATAKTMIGVARMRNLRRLVETVLADGVKGDLVEAGVWRGGACIYMRGILAAYGVADRTVWVADSFAGLPPPDAQRYPADRDDPHHTIKELAVSLDEVKRNFEQFGLLDEQVAFLPGWFKDTLPGAPIKKLCVLRLDGDMYGSTIETLEALYPRVARGGAVIIDDYLLEPCQKAVHDYRRRFRITEQIHDVDGAAAYWRKNM
jgi:hypothetical protein